MVFVAIVRQFDHRDFDPSYDAAALKGDRQVVTEAIVEDAPALVFVSAELKGGQQVVMAAVANEVLAFKFASAELKGDRQVVMEAVA